MWEQGITGEALYDPSRNKTIRLSPDRIRQLEELGFEWSLRNRTCQKKPKPPVESESSSEDDGESHDGGGSVQNVEAAVALKVYFNSMR